MRGDVCMDRKTLEKLMHYLIVSGDLIKRRKDEETFTENFGKDFSLDIMCDAIGDMFELKDSMCFGGYFFINQFYDSKSLGKDSIILKVGFQKEINGKRGYRSGFSVYLVHFDGEKAHFMPTVRVDLEDPTQEGLIVPHSNEYPEGKYTAEELAVYKKFFTAEEPAPHIHFYNDAVSEEYKKRNGSDDKGINGNAISLDHLLDYYGKLAEIEGKKARREKLTEEEKIIDTNNFGMPYLYFRDSGKLENYVTNADLAKTSILSRFDGTPVVDEIIEEIGFVEGKISGLKALMFDTQYAIILSRLLNDDRYIAHHAAIKNSLTDLLTKTSMQLSEFDITLDNRLMESYGIIDEESWITRTNGKELN